MSNIFNPNPDPDYPVPNAIGFIQHTYQNVAPPQQFWYNGQQLVPQNGLDSRRYDGIPQATPQNVVPQMAPQQYGFNQLVESRRAMQAPAQVNVQNPWAVQSTTQAPQAVQSQVPMPMPMPTNTYYPSMQNPEYNALCNCRINIDKTTDAWGNREMYSTITPPTVQWGAAPAAVPQNVPQYGYMYSQPLTQQPQMTYPQPQLTQPITQDWATLAAQNFAK